MDSYGSYTTKKATVSQMVFFFYRHSGGAVENLKNTVCCAFHKIVLALTERLNVFVAFSPHSLRGPLQNAGSINQ